MYEAKEDLVGVWDMDNLFVVSLLLVLVLGV